MVGNSPGKISVMVGSTFIWNHEVSGAISSCFVEVLPPKGDDKIRTPIYRYIIAGTAGSLSMYGAGEQVWTRDEGPTRWIENGVVLFDIVKEEHKVKETQVLEGSKAFAFEKSVLQNILRFLGISSVLGDENVKTDEFEDLLGTNVGFTKFAIGSSEDGVVTALDLGSQGKTVWRVKLNQKEVGEGIKEVRKSEGSVVAVTTNDKVFLYDFSLFNCLTLPILSISG
jgi:hypothetical protein